MGADVTIDPTSATSLAEDGTSGEALDLALESAGQAAMRLAPISSFELCVAPGGG